METDLEIIEVIDSALKIGLGAAISTIAAYRTMRANHTNERYKEFRAHKIKTIEMIAERVERFIASYVGFRNRVGGALRRRMTDDEYTIDPRTLESLRELDKDLFAGLENANIARARLSLMRAEGAKREIADMIDLVARLRNPIMQENKAPSKIDYDIIVNEMSGAINRFHKELAALYESIP